MIKLLAVDIDDTLTDSDGNVSTAAITALQRAQAGGMLVALVSARPPAGVDVVADRLGGDVFRVSYLGAVIRDPNRKEVHRLSLSMEAARAIANLADDAGISLTMMIDDVEYHSQHVVTPALTTSISVALAEAMLIGGKPPALISTEGYEGARYIYSFCVERSDGALNMSRHMRADGTYSSVTIVHSMAEKGNALTAICKLLAITKSEVLAIGDNEGDASMFRAAGISVSVGGADAAVNETATHVAPLLDGQGVAWALERFL